MRWKITVVLLVVAMLFAACGKDEGTTTTAAVSTTEGATTTATAATTTTAAPTTTAAALTDVILLIPNPSAVIWYNACAAIGQGFFEEEGLSVRTEALDGSGAVLQAIAAGQAQFGAPGPGPMLSALERGEGFVGIYNHFAQSLFGVVVPEDSEYQLPADLAGTVIGVGTAEGTEVGFARSILTEAGLTEGTDYEFLPVGDGGQATAAFERGDIVAYAAGLPDMAVIEARGLPLRDLTPDNFKSYFGNMYATAAATVADNPELVQAFINGLVKGTVFGQDPANRAAVLADCNELNPEEGSEADLAGAILDLALERTVPLGGANPGMFDMAGWELWQTSLLESASLAAAQDLTKIFTNEFVEAAYAAGLGG